MTRKAKLWTGITLLLILTLNYAIIRYPLTKRSASLKNKARQIVLSKSSDDEYFLELYRKERLAIDRKTLLVNCASVSLAILIASWTVFGLIVHRKK